MRAFTEIERLPAYGPMEASHYLRLPIQKTTRWAKALCTSGAEELFPISFINLLELHMLKAMRLTHNVPMPRIKRAVEELRSRYQTEYPLLHPGLLTDGLDVLIRDKDSIINLSRFGQQKIQEVVSLYVQRIEIEDKLAKLFPFISTESAAEPRTVLICPSFGFGRPVVSGTGISTEVIAGRFHARESMQDLAEEYRLSLSQIEEVIRWEMNSADAA